MFNRNTLIVLAIAAAFAGLVTGWHVSNRHLADAAGPELQTMKRFETPRALPPFRLTRHDGQPLDNAALKGHWTMVFIGFTHCPDVCPTTLAQLKVAQDQWTSIPEAKRPRVMFVAVDPERDTPEITGTYAHAFHPDTIAATGTQKQLEDFARGLSLVFMKNPPDDPSKPERYNVDHSAALAVIDPEGRMSGVIQPPLEPNKIATDFIALTEEIK
ncbi:SCO family protein [Solilutibacter tolerans]|uniref:Protein SCO1/2 n=1 Tax=Solilutibacter tolerans TaxID=1604334 RepID=A0A1N6VT47_9GAMM|nr:SCO family protein [Lysobacter tolerans]SIQ80958.1 protein SCO1/2 [Lysobacter tolerans]